MAVSLKSERPFLSLSASDISETALETAALNASRLLLRNTAVQFIKSDLFESISGRFRIIVSNPPYIPTEKIDILAPELQREPRIALDGGEGGLELIKKIIPSSLKHLNTRGVLLLEADPQQMPEILRLLSANNFCEPRIYNDLAGLARVVSVRLLN